MTRPAAVAVWVVAALAVALLDADPASRVLVLAGAWALLWRRRAAGRRLRPLALGLFVVGLVTVALNGMLSHTGATVVGILPSWLPLVGGAVTAEGFADGTSIALGLVAAISVTAVLSVVVEPTDLVDALPRPFHHAGAALGAALNLVPATAASFVAVREAQRLRGWRPRGTRALVDLAVPVLLGAIDRSVQLAEAMESRAFGAGRRTTMAADERSALLAAVAALALLAGALAVAVSAAGQGSWYPYPVPTVPSLAPLALAPALLLGLAGAILPAEPR
ncbi:MAG TPA: energy-coupling factor transporter transmembrane component T [Acidimicrobiales bacterium]|nr:energy-coupling factor transporter transmembrane component T [Acidimicrobiales bacterium]